MGKDFEVNVSLYQEHVTDLQAHLLELKKARFDSSVVTVVHPSVHKGIHIDPNGEDGLRPDTILYSQEWYEKVIPKLSEHLDLESFDQETRNRDEKALSQEIAYMDHIVQNKEVLLKLKMRGSNTNLARNICKRTKGTIVVEVPMKNHVNVWRSDIDGKHEATDPWLVWNKFRMTAGFNPALRLGLVLSEDIPTKNEMQRWLGESIAYIIIPSHIFIRNAQHYPVLSRNHQAVVRELLQATSNFMIKSSHADNNQLYREYVTDYLCKKYLTPDIMLGYENLLEIPLQPLFNNLDCYTYEIFEKDPVKYKLYQAAIEAALLDKVPVAVRKTKKVIIMIVGGGRGPIVRAAINASCKTGIKVKILVVEKNPNATVVLRAHIREVWAKHDVTLFSRDMRDFNPPEKADIMVSELLGSFGDNELSPECLDGAQKHLKPDGISIPANSVSYLNPVMSTNLYNGCRSLDRYRPTVDRTNAPQLAIFENAYVVYPKHVYHIDEPKEVFTFVHPNHENPDHTRACSLSFTADTDCILHGFIGYFESVLYKDIILSIHPRTHTIGMASWFSFYIPITAPQFVREGQKIEMNMWRCVSPHKVWYEWNVSNPIMTHIHNLNGESSNIMK